MLKMTPVLDNSNLLHKIFYSNIYVYIILAFLLILFVTQDSGKKFLLFLFKIPLFSELLTLMETMMTRFLDAFYCLVKKTM